MTPRPGLFPVGTDVIAVLARDCEVQRHTGRAPLPDATIGGTIGSDGTVTLTGAAGAYVLFAVTNEVQTITVKAKKGKFKISFGGKTTPGLKFDASAAEIKTALAALESIGSGNIEVTGGPGDEAGTKPYVLEFIGKFTGDNVAAVTTDVSELEESPKTATVATSTGGAYDQETPRTLAFTID